MPNEPATYLQAPRFRVEGQLLSASCGAEQVSSCQYPSKGTPKDAHSPKTLNP